MDDSHIHFVFLFVSVKQLQTVDIGGSDVFGSLVVGGDECFYTERIHIAHLVVVDGTVYFLAPIWMVGHYVGNLQPGGVEGLAGRDASDASVLQLGRY